MATLGSRGPDKEKTETQQGRTVNTVTSSHPAHTWDLPAYLQIPTSRSGLLTLSGRAGITPRGSQACTGLGAGLSSLELPPSLAAARTDPGRVRWSLPRHVPLRSGAVCDPRDRAHMQELLPAGKRLSADPGRQETSALSQLAGALQTQDASIKQPISPQAGAKAG